MGVRNRLNLASAMMLLGGLVVGTRPNAAPPSPREVEILNSTHRRHKRGPGWGRRHVKRMALKARNQAKHRRACKRAGR